MDNYRLWVRFANGEAKIVDFTPILDSPAFQPLKDIEVFTNVYIDYGIPVWNNGNIDIAPDFLYNHGVPAEEATVA